MFKARYIGQSFFSEPEKLKAVEVSTDACIGIKAVVFDIFGTVLNLTGSLSTEFRELFAKKGISHVDGKTFAEKLIQAYSENMTKISDETHPFALVDELNHVALEESLNAFNIFDLFTDKEREHMSQSWHRLDPWPDSVSGIEKIKAHFTTGPLSNGNIKLLTDVSDHAGIEWDIILSGETIRCYKPNPVVYQYAAEALGLEPSEILLAASHRYDLDAARQCGFKTAYITRTKNDKGHQSTNGSEFDFEVSSIDHLANELIDAIQEKRTQTYSQ